MDVWSPCETDKGQSRPQRDRQPTEDVPVAAVPEEVEASESESGETVKTNLIGRTAEEFIDKLNANDVSKQYFSNIRSSERALNTTLGLTDRSNIESSKKRNIKAGILDKQGKPKAKRRSSGVRKEYR